MDTTAVVQPQPPQPHAPNLSRRRGSVSAGDPYGLHESKNLPSRDRRMTSRLTIVRVGGAEAVENSSRLYHSDDLPPKPKSHLFDGNSHTTTSANNRAAPRPGRLSFVSTFARGAPSGGPALPSIPASTRRRSTTVSTYSPRASLTPAQVYDLARSSVKSASHSPLGPSSPTRQTELDAVQRARISGGSPANFTLIPEKQFLPFIDRPSEVFELLDSSPTNRLMALLEHAFPALTTSKTHAEQSDESLGNQIDFSNPETWPYTTLVAWMCRVTRADIDDEEWIRRVRACVMTHNEQICMSLLAALGAPADFSFDSPESDVPSFHGHFPRDFDRSFDRSYHYRDLERDSEGASESPSSPCSPPILLIHPSPDSLTLTAGPQERQKHASSGRHGLEEYDAHFPLDIVPVPLFDEEKHQLHLHHLQAGKPLDTGNGAAGSSGTFGRRSRSGSASSWGSSRSSSRLSSAMESIGESEGEGEGASEEDLTPSTEVILGALSVGQDTSGVETARSRTPIDTSGASKGRHGTDESEHEKDDFGRAHIPGSNGAPATSVPPSEPDATSSSNFKGLRISTDSQPSAPSPTHDPSPRPMSPLPPITVSSNAASAGGASGLDDAPRPGRRRNTVNVAHVLSEAPGHAGFKWSAGGPRFPASFATVSAPARRRQFPSARDEIGDALDVVGRKLADSAQAESEQSLFDPSPSISASSTRALRSSTVSQAPHTNVSQRNVFSSQK
ncbi:hypothetical protein HETIRDRAFT_164633 [Heterobasidion irregulare TC 32-1]|uniref:Uncharacterized protein n=1 Tax=Heterobasidion irregulare (strain TC 32-1) TaxID=747525 RepID=W4JQ63_HETIT|nr:uncharacterized protein HETIRDRAFT_164633 [Heterobasidion irregulare TC 32-1]ETW75220.1 hypothetical protein HETIRDRAFT_164633 [Heterobasidion irregulare TC 32-1]